MKNEALEWWNTLEYDEKLALVTQYCPGVNLEYVEQSESKIELIYLKIYYPEGIE